MVQTSPLRRSEDLKLPLSMPKSLHAVALSVSEEELRRLGKRFKKLDIDKNGTISIEEFMSLPELQQNPLVRRVIDLFDTDRNGEIDFKGQNLMKMICYYIFCCSVRINSLSIPLLADA